MGFIQTFNRDVPREAGRVENRPMVGGTTEKGHKRPKVGTTSVESEEMSLPSSQS
jgi:hypothetical protein